MSIQKLVKTNDWKEVEEIIKKKKDDMLNEPLPTGDYKTIAVHAVAKELARKVLNDWLKEMKFITTEPAIVSKRSFN